MINSKNGHLNFGDKLVIKPEQSEADFKKLFKDATLDWENPPRSAYRFTHKFDAGGTVLVTTYFTEQVISDVILAFNDGSIDPNAENAKELVSALHQQLLEEWLGDAPYRYEWGAVQLLNNNPFSNRTIAVQYN